MFQLFIALGPWQQSSLPAKMLRDPKSVLLALQYYGLPRTYAWVKILQNVACFWNIETNANDIVSDFPLSPGDIVEQKLFY